MQKTEIVEYSATAAAVAELRHRMTGVVYSITQASGMAAAKADRAELRTLRTSLEKERVRIKEPALAHIRLLDSEAKRLTAEITSLEDPIDEQIKAEEARKEAIRIEKVAAEARRVETLNARVTAISLITAEAAKLPSGEIENLLESFGKMAPSEESFEEFLPLAQLRHAQAVIDLRILLGEVVKREADAVVLAAEKLELEQLRVLAARNAMEAELRAHAEAKIAKEREEAAQAEAKAARQAEQARARAEAASQKIIMDELAAKAAADRIAFEAQIAAARAEAAETKLAAEEAQARHQRDLWERDQALKRAHAAEISTANDVDVTKFAAITTISTETTAIAAVAAIGAAPVPDPGAWLDVDVERPDRVDIIAVVADHFEVSYETAELWLMSEFTEVDHAD